MAGRAPCSGVWDLVCSGTGAHPTSDEIGEIRTPHASWGSFATPRFSGGGAIGGWSPYGELWGGRFWVLGASEGPDRVYRSAGVRPSPEPRDVHTG